MTSSLSVITTTDPVARQLPELLAALSALAQQQRLPIEVIVVDDLHWWPSAAACAPGDWPELTIRVIWHAQQRGQLASMLEGIQAATGNTLLTIDPDMHPCVEEIPEMQALLQQGYRIVHGRRGQRADISPLRRLGSALANSIVRALTGLQVEDIGSPVTLMDRGLLAENASLLSEDGNPRLHLYLRCANVLTSYTLQHGSRTDSRSQYNLPTLIRTFLSLVRDSLRTR